MLASTLENARAGNYIYSPETDAIDPEVVIEINQYIIDQELIHAYLVAEAARVRLGVNKLLNFRQVICIQNYQ